MMRPALLRDELLPRESRLPRGADRKIDFGVNLGACLDAVPAESGLLPAAARLQCTNSASGRIWASRSRSA